MTGIGVIAYGCYTTTEISGTAKDPVDPVPSINEIKWRNVSDEPFKRFGQLDALSKVIMVATEMVGIEKNLPDELKPNAGIVLGTCEGCLGTDIDFYAGALEREIANPRLFAYTLPSTVCGDIAIRYRLQGPNACFQHGERSAVLALRESYHLIASGEVQACLCIGADALFARSSETAVAHDMLSGQNCFGAYAFLLAEESAAKAPRLCEFTIGDDEADYLIDDSATLENLRDWIRIADDCIPTIRIG